MPIIETIVGVGLGIPGNYVATATQPARLQQYGVPMGPLPIQRLADPPVCRQLLDEAGFTEIEVRSEPLGYTLGAPRSAGGNCGRAWKGCRRHS